jgi:hypothetical protein
VAIIQEYEDHRLEDLGRVPEAIVSYRESVATDHPYLDQPSATIMSQYLTESPSMRQKRHKSTSTLVAEPQWMQTRLV